MYENREQFWALYLSRFAEGFGFITLVTLLPFYIAVLDPSSTTILGVTISAGLIVGMFASGYTIGKALSIVPLSWAGDRFDKRLVLLAVLGISVPIYALFPLVDSSASFILLRVLQGVAVTGSSLMGLALVGQIADVGTRANHIGKANAANFAASIVGSLSAGLLYDRFGFGPIFTVIVCVLLVAWFGTYRYLGPDETRVKGFPFSGLAFNRRILTLSSFRVQYAFSVEMVRVWIAVFAGLSAAEGGLAFGAFVVSLVVAAEKFTNMICQPFTGRLSDAYGRALFVFGGGGAYGVVALAVPFAPAIGSSLSLPATYPGFGELSPAFLPLIGLSALLGVVDSFREPASMALFADEGTSEGSVASSFGIRELVWRPGSIAGPLLAGWLMTEVSMASVFYVGGAFALTGAGTFLVILLSVHGRDALRTW
ncbi:MFS transporter [Natrialbaceae archaeon A-CW3]